MVPVFEVQLEDVSLNVDSNSVFDSLKFIEPLLGLRMKMLFASSNISLPFSTDEMLLIKLRKF